MQIKEVLATYQWQTLTIKWEKYSKIELLFVINDYEAFFRDPFNNGVFKIMETETLLRNWVDRQDLIFTLEKRIFDDGSVYESPVINTQREIFGTLKDLAQVLRNNAPDTGFVSSIMNSDSKALQWQWEYRGFSWHLVVPKFPYTIHKPYQ